MANIKVNDLKPKGFELFDDSETFLTDLSDKELDIMGGLQLAASGCGSLLLCCITKSA